MDYEALAENIGEVREVLRAMVAGLIADGFSEDQSRRLVVAMMEHNEDEEEVEE